MHINKKYLLALLSSLSTVFIHGATLFDNGHTTYSIVISELASLSEQTAAKELQYYLNQISGAAFGITNVTNSNLGNQIYIGYNSTVAQLTGNPVPNQNDESFTYQSIGDDIIIYGGSQRGTMYGVFSFLENELGVRWYTAEYTRIPKKKSWTFKSLNHKESPFIQHRYTMYYRCGDDKTWAAHNKNNFCWNAQHNEYGGLEACRGVHTLYWLLPEDLFDKHPEYFALRDGKRNVKAQRCLSNKNVFEIVKENLLKDIKDNPNYLYYDVSQLDNQLFCECNECRKIEARYGGEHSGLIIWFVNKLADEMAKIYPQKRLTTLAYRYTRRAPKNIKPRENVTIRLCDIECCFAHPLEECPENKSFVQDFKDWGELTQNIFIWDYIVNFGQYLMPYPNFGVLAENIKTFKKHGATIVLEQGQRQSYGGEFGDLKAWVTARLLWNPEQSTNKIVKDFINGYYGASAKYIQQYYNMCQSVITPDTHIYQKKDVCQLYSDDFIQKAEYLLSRARAAAKTEHERSSVEAVRAQIMYLKKKLHPVESKLNGNTEEFNKYIERTKPHLRESQSAEQYLKESGYI